MQTEGYHSMSHESARISVMESDIRALREEVADLAERLDTVERELAAMRTALARLLVQGVSNGR